VLGFLFLPLRAVLFAFFHDPYALMACQVFDGLAAGIFGIVGVLMIADCTQGTGHYNLALGLMGMAVGIGASISTTMAGFIAQNSGYPAAFLTLAASGLAALFVLWLFMPETKNAETSQALNSLEPKPGADKTDVRGNTEAVRP
jgi:MFS family permease